MFKVLFVLFAAISFVYARHEEYDGHSLYEIKVENADQVNQLMDVVERLLLDVWTYAHPERDGLILVSKKLKPQFEDELDIIGLTYRIETENIRDKLVLEDQLLANASLSQAKRSHPGLSFDVIHRYAVVDRYLTELADRYPTVVQVASGGSSVEGRDIKYLRISSNNFQTNSKPVVVIQSLLHAREWVTLPVALYAIHKLVIDVTEQDLIRDIDWVIIPIANPDGYEFSHTRTRMWRKNRRNQRGLCMGVDLNRNFDFNWGTSGSSNQACSDTFHGPRALSEPESQMTANIIERYRTRIALFLDVHAFGSMVLYGYGNRQVPPNVDTLHEVATQMAKGIDAVKLPSNRNYRVGNIVQVLNYLASGGCSDFAQNAIGNRLSYTFELPAYRNQNGVNGFLVDPAFIHQVGIETWEGIKIAARYVVRNR